MLVFKTCSSPLRALLTSIPRSYYKHKGIALAKPQVLNGQFKRHYSSADAMQKIQSHTSEEEEIKAFNDVFPSLVDFLKKDLEKRNMNDVADWYAEMMHYTVPHGKQIRPLGIIDSYKILVPDASEKQRHISRIVGWCMEMVNATYIVTDDILDESITRRGQLCWHRKDKVGMKAINDSLMILTSIYKILIHYIEDEKVRANLMDCFTEVLWVTGGGQGTESLGWQPDGSPNWKKYTVDRFYLVANYKTAYYTMCIPMQLSLILAGKKEAYAKSVEDLLIYIGSFIQVQNDYLDCFGDPKITAKIGTDIEEGQCSWLITTALQMANSKDKEILMNNYGKKGDSEKVKEVYTRIGMKQIFTKSEEELFKNACKQIEVVSKETNLPKDIFYVFLNKICNFQSHIFKK